jgi:hypothetical protein
LLGILTDLTYKSSAVVQALMETNFRCVLSQLLHNASVDVRLRACDVLANIIRSEPHHRKFVVQAELLKELLQIVGNTGEREDVRHHALFAIGGAVISEVGIVLHLIDLDAIRIIGTFGDDWVSTHGQQLSQLKDRVDTDDATMHRANVILDTLSFLLRVVQDLVKRRTSTVGNAMSPSQPGSAAPPRKPSGLRFARELNAVGDVLVRDRASSLLKMFCEGAVDPRAEHIPS